MLEKCYTHEHEDSLLVQWEEETGEHLVLIRSRWEHDELVKTYEGFLGVKLADDKVTELDHLDIVDYRLDKGIDDEIHRTALHNLGWQEDR